MDSLTTKQLKPQEEMVYRDDPDLPAIDDGGGGGEGLRERGGGGTNDGSAAAEAPLEVPQYRDDPWESPDAGAYDDTGPQSIGKTGYTSPKRASRGKFILGICVVAALAIGVFVYSKSSSTVNDAPSKPLFTDMKTGVRGNPSSNGQQSSSGGACEDDASFVHTNGKTCQTFVEHVGRVSLRGGRCGQDTGMVGTNGEQLLVEDFCRQSCGLCGGSGMGEEEVMQEIHDEMKEVEAAAPAPVPAPPAKPKPEHTTSLPNTSNECEDDATYVHQNHKTCANFVAHVGRPTLHVARCSQGTGILDTNGVELLLHHFCKKSCNYCDAASAAKEDEDEAALVASQEKAKEDAAVGGAEKAKEDAAAAAAAEKEAAEAAAAAAAASEAAAAAAAEESNENEENVPEEEADQIGSQGDMADETTVVVTNPMPGDSCEDDASFVHTNGKTCQTFVAHVGKVALKEGRCSQETGMVGANGPLFVHDFCRLSCGLCGEVGDASVIAEEGPPPAIDNEVPPPTEDMEDQEEGAGGDSTSEGKFNEPPVGDTVPADVGLPGDETPSGEVPPNESSAVDQSFDDSIVEYFVPLTPAEREAMKEKLRGTLKSTKDALSLASTSTMSQRTLVLDPNSPKQFMNLQHKQTGDESVVDLIQCAVGRQNQIASSSGLAITYSAISEDRNLDTCRADLGNRLGATVNDGEFFKTNAYGMMVLIDPTDGSSNIPEDYKNACDTVVSHVMTYDTSFRAVEQFGWSGVESISMIADPVERTYQLYQKAAEECYGCKGFKDILMAIHDGTFESDDESCKTQMIGHQAVNLLSSSDLIMGAYDVTFPREQDIVDEAVKNLRERITWIGVLDQIEDSVSGFKEIFPWLSDNLEGAVAVLEKELPLIGENVDDPKFALPLDYHDSNSCMFEHKQEDHFTCGSREVDEETLQWIRKLNMRDQAVYKAAMERFDIQQEVLNEYHQVVNS